MANRIRGITVEIGGDTTKLSKALEGDNKNIFFSAQLTCVMLFASDFAATN